MDVEFDIGEDGDRTDFHRSAHNLDWGPTNSPYNIIAWRFSDVKV